MKALELYNKLEHDFIFPELSDEWYGIEDYGEFLCENFKDRSMGVVCDNSIEINKVYTAVFPEDNVMEKILEDDVCDALLFLHHPLIWDLRDAPNVFHVPKTEYLEKFKKRNISIYCLHVPLDNFSKYSTSNTLAKALGIEVKKTFHEYFGSLSGIIGKTECKNVQELKEKFAEAVGHDVSLYNYGDSEIKDGNIAIVAGGGNDLEILKDVKKEGINTFITGITYLGEYSKKVHDFEKTEKINLLGGTHYSTEKFACQEMCNYFKDLGLKSEFISGRIGIEDL